MSNRLGKRTHIVKVTLNDEELAIILNKAKISGLSVASMLRLLGIKASVTYT